MDLRFERTIWPGARMKCGKCQATWEFGPSDVCPICSGPVRGTEEPAKPKNSAPLSQTKAWWEFDRS